MILVTGVRFKPAGKIYYFDKNGLDIKKDDYVLVETSRGKELGTVVFVDNKIQDESLNSSLKPILSVATDYDLEIKRQNEELALKALKECKSIIEEHNLNMNLIDSEYTFDKNKLIFYFTAESRVDFRNLVKDLASRFRTRIELRQVGVRDEAKLIKSMGKCGVKTCCSNWMGEFASVSIKMAKDQNLSLNPTKISGMCGRLMCCLNFEHETYVKLEKKMAKNGEKVITNDGEAIVIGVNIIKEELKVKHIKGFNKEENKYDLSEDIITYKNSDVKRLPPRNKTNKSENHDK